MRKFKVTVYVLRKVECLNPEEPTTLRALNGLGLEHVVDIRMGRVFLLTIHAMTENQVRAAAETACRKLLANLVMEHFEIVKVEEIK